ncbi:hypothetical protein F53441_3864 [Fusarium austroafricanum]|uniref:Uncharacterized protein n=1 Tax=Fusarium austroafricanum TaxID=2364996 RepID=A0A8H4NW80_9HYPO|nr:hypothetical protein F53441_3864 [Fusarium austroafricanum]
MLAACASQVRCQNRLTAALRPLAIAIARATIFQRYQQKTLSAASLALYMTPQGMLKRCVTALSHPAECGALHSPLRQTQSESAVNPSLKVAELAGTMARRGHSSTFTLGTFQHDHPGAHGWDDDHDGRLKIRGSFQALGVPPASRCATEPLQLSAEPDPKLASLPFPFSTVA